VPDPVALRLAVAGHGSGKFIQLPTAVQTAHDPEIKEEEGTPDGPGGDIATDRIKGEVGPEIEMGLAGQPGRLVRQIDPARKLELGAEAVVVEAARKGKLAMPVRGRQRHGHRQNKDKKKEERTHATSLSRAIDEGQRDCLSREEPPPPEGGGA